MRLFAYYALHSFVNQVKKLFKTWVLIFIVACMLIGGLTGYFAASMSEKKEELDAAEQTETAEEKENEGPSFLEMNGLERMEMIELIVGVVVLGMLFLFAMNSDKNGAKIFQPADVNLLFASPMKPQSVLMFRLASQLGVALLAILYLIFQLPNLILNLGMSAGGAVIVLFGWCLTVAMMTLVRVFLYILSTSHPKIRENLHRGILAVILLIAAGYVLTLVRSGAGYLKAADLYLNWDGSRWIPVWGWLKGVFVFAIEGRYAMSLLCFALSIAIGALLVFLSWRMKADFYEDAMAKSEETAELLERARSEKAGVQRRKKADRSERISRDGMKHGCGANVFFFKEMYNRFRFAHFHFFTKTMETYLAAAIAVGAVCRFGPGTDSVIPLGLALVAFAFFRTLGNPLEKDTQMDYFVLIPENTWAKMFWSVMGGTVNCLLDVLPAIVVGTLVLGGNFLSALAWVPFIVSVDFYGTNVGAFINLSVPVRAGKSIKQIVQIMFIYFGLLPDALLIVLGLVYKHIAVAAIGAAAVNIVLGFLFFGLAPIFLDPRGGRVRSVGHADAETLRTARRSFSRMGLGCFALILSASVLQTVALSLMTGNSASISMDSWAFWLCAFLPIYLIGVPLAWLIIRRVPAQRPVVGKMSVGRFLVTVIICVFMMYAGNLVGVLLTSGIQVIFGTQPTNAVVQLSEGGGILPKLLFMVIIGPIAEELVYRKMLIDRIAPYGERLAVVTSAVMFGLFHGNFSQMFYAFALGLVFGYVYLRTGKLRYTVGLHMLINFLGSILAPSLLERAGDSLPESLDFSDLAALQELASPGLLVFGGYVLVMLCLAIAGLVLFCIRARQLRFSEAEKELPRGKCFRTVYINVGMLLFILVCVAMIVISLLPG